MAKSKLSGAWGEALAAEYLRKKRYKILAAGYHSRFGEIDLIAQDKKYLLFVEVKLRKSADFAKAMEYVDRRKQDYRVAVFIRKSHKAAATLRCN